jgi:hypothetical protein
MTSKNISQWVKELVNEENVKVCIILVPDVTNTDCTASGAWAVYSGN